jgi:hypothetical protein
MEGQGMSTDRRSLQLRAQEIINASPDGMTVNEALKRALLERYGNDVEALANAAASLGAGMLKGLRKRTYDLPEQEDGVLFQIPSVIGISTPEGDLLIPREQANTGQVKQWQKEGLQHHSTQVLRFKRAGRDLESLKDEPDDLPWWSARAMLTGIELDDEDDE